MSIIDSAVNWAVGIAEDDSHGYDQINRSLGDPNGTDYDCSSLVCTAWQQAGVKVIDAGASYTGNMRKAFLKCGFKEVDIKTRKRGDVLLNENHHTAMMIDGNRLVHASINEQGKVVGGKKGDQTKKEICIRDYYNYSRGWDCCLRYPEENTVPKKAVNDTYFTVKVTASDGLNVRTGPAKSFSLSGTPLSYGSKVEVAEVKNGWGRTKYGWICLAYTVRI